MLVLFGAREVLSNPPVSRLPKVTIARVFTSSILNNQGCITFRGAVVSNKFLYRVRRVGASLYRYSNALLSKVVDNTNEVLASVERFE